MSLVFEQPAPGPAAHAIIIGVGTYAHVPSPDFPGLGELSSPPHSARAMATWLLSEYHNDDRPLASLELLVSEGAAAGTFTPPGGAETAVERATFANAEQALKRWKARGDANAGHLMLFYFCGHGVARGSIASLLLEDFAADPGDPLQQAINFTEFYSGMDRCLARQQCYFVDACRVVSEDLLLRYAGYAGEPIFHGSATGAAGGTRYAPIFYATTQGSRAYSLQGQPSLFSQALLKSLRGAGSQRPAHTWLVKPGNLYIGLDFVLQRLVEGAQGALQVCSSDNLVNAFALHYLPGEPTLPVAVGCVPDKATAAAELSCMLPDGSSQVRPAQPAQPARWDLDLPPGNYEFRARFAAGDFQDGSAQTYLYPPGQDVEIEVTK
jgi:hypothetical protein